VARILGLDIGERRIGVAISDPEGRLAVPLRIVERTSTAEQALAELARAEEVELIVLGLPLSMDGSVGAQARVVQAFGEGLAQASGLPIEYQDERLSSVQADRTSGAAHKHTGRGGRRGRAPADDVAAAIILQGYLDRQRARRERDGP